MLLAAPDQLVLQIPGDGLSLPSSLSPPLPQLAERFFPDHDLVIAEGFKYATGVVKIETRRDGEPLTAMVDGVAAVVTNGDDASHEHLFRPYQIAELTDFIEKTVMASGERQVKDQAQTTRVSLTIGGQALPLKAWVQEALAGTVLGFVAALKKTDGMSGEVLVLRIHSRKP